MKYYKNKNQVYAYESDGSQDGIIPDDAVLMTDEEVEAHLDNGPAPTAMDLLRAERTRLLSSTDWWGSPDLTMTQEQKDYSKDLRDLPSTASPELGSDGLSITNVTWPTKPE